MTRRATTDLSSLNIPTLEHPIAFGVFAHDSDPHETGYLTVCADDKGIRLRWAGDKADEYSSSWAEFRWFLAAMRREEAELRRKEQERAELREQVRLGQEMADDIERAKFSTRRTAAVQVVR